MKLTMCAWLAVLAIASTACAQYHPPHPDTAAAELQIRNKISLYALAIDAKNFGLLDQIFTPDAVVDYNYTGQGVLNGVAAVKAYVAEQLQGLVTQHTISTTVVDFGPPGQQHTPNSTAYLVANYLGQRSLAGQTLFFYGVYTDQWVFEAGSWKSKNRLLNFLPPGYAGNLAILDDRSG